MGRYQLEERIGRGAMGEVWRASRRLADGSKDHVALKFVPEHHADNAAVLRRFEREARLCMGMNHEHVIQVFDWDVIDDRSCIVMEHIDGLTLKQLARRGCLPFDAIRRMLRESLSGLLYAHQLGVLHRDISMNNIMVARDGTVKILDFGLARCLDEPATSGVLKGTLRFAAPESLRWEVWERGSDIYSIGAVFYTLLTGTPPYGDGDRYRILQTMDAREVVPLGDDVPTDVREFIMFALGKPGTRTDAAIADACAHFDLNYGDECLREQLGALVAATPTEAGPIHGNDDSVRAARFLDRLAGIVDDWPIPSQSALGHEYRALPDRMKRATETEWRELGHAIDRNTAAHVAMHDLHARFTARLVGDRAGELARDGRPGKCSRHGVLAGAVGALIVAAVIVVGIVFTGSRANPSNKAARTETSVPPSVPPSVSKLEPGMLVDASVAVAVADNTVLMSNKLEMRVPRTVTVRDDVDARGSLDDAGAGMRNNDFEAINDVFGRNIDIGNSLDDAAFLRVSGSTTNTHGVQLSVERGRRGEDSLWLWGSIFNGDRTAYHAASFWMHGDDPTVNHVRAVRFSSSESTQGCSARGKVSPQLVVASRSRLNIRRNCGIRCSR